MKEILMRRRRFLGTVAAMPAAGAALASSHEAGTAKFNPGAAVKLIVPNEPGGNMDMVARFLATELSLLWAPWPVVVQYRPGAGTVVGSQFVAKAKPDGCTIGVIATPHVLNPSVQALPYDSEKDFTPLARIGTTDLLFSCTPSLEVSDFEAALARIRQHPGRYNCAAASVGSSMYFAMELIKQRAGLDFVHVPFNGGSKIFTEVFAGRVEFLVDPMTSSLPHVKSGRLVPLASTGRRRNAQLPSVPTLAEFFPGLFVESFLGLVAPAGMDADTADRMYQDIHAVLKQRHVSEVLQGLSFTTTPMGPAEFSNFLSSEIKRWRGVAKRANLGVS